jgi:antitoxin (DNA-binding transcriptional repressor) of toxin-antitoxin stability system
VITDHGQPVARIIRETVSLRERVEALRKAGAIAWSGRRLRPAKPAGRVRDAKTVADLVVENRE